MSAGNDWGDGRHLCSDAVWGVLEGLNALGVASDDVVVTDLSPWGPLSGVCRVRVKDGPAYVVSVKEV